MYKNKFNESIDYDEYDNPIFDTVYDAMVYNVIDGNYSPNSLIRKMKRDVNIMDNVVTKFIEDRDERSRKSLVSELRDMIESCETWIERLDPKEYKYI